MTIHGDCPRAPGKGEAEAAMCARALHITATEACRGLWMQLKTQSFPQKRSVEMCQPDGKRQPQELFMVEVSHM